jgi:hypothetical protein
MRAWPPTDHPGLRKLCELRAIVESSNACALPVKYDSFVPILQRAMSRGYVYVLNGLRYGFDVGFQLGKLKGVIAFKNYRSSLDHRDTVSKAVYARVDATSRQH